MINNIHKAFVKIRNLLNTTLNSRNNSYFITIYNNETYSLKNSLMKFKKNLNEFKNNIKISTLNIYFDKCNFLKFLAIIQIEMVNICYKNFPNSSKSLKTFIIKLKKNIKKDLKIKLSNNSLKITSHINQISILYCNFLFLLSKFEFNYTQKKIKIFLKKKLKNFVKSLKILLKFNSNNNFFLNLFKYNPVNTKLIISNNIYYIFKNLGIEASRLFIYESLLKITKKQKIKTKRTYIALISDYLTYNGKLNGITLSKQFRNKTSTLHLTSLEKSIYTLKKSTLVGEIDNIKGFVESIFSGKQMPFGTGLFNIIF